MEENEITFEELTGDIEQVINRVLAKSFPPDIEAHFAKLRDERRIVACRSAVGQDDVVFESQTNVTTLLRGSQHYCVLVRSEAARRPREQPTIRSVYERRQLARLAMPNVIRANNEQTKRPLIRKDAASPQALKTLHVLR